MSTIFENFELNIFNQSDIKCIAGVDEAGRGPLAGPVVAGLVVFSKDKLERFYTDSRFKFLAESLNDSKKLTSAMREKLAWQIQSLADYYNTVEISHLVIDQINILNASLLAFKKTYEQALADLFEIDYLLIDGNKKVKDLGIKQEAIVKGDQKCLSIAAASILAKVARDKLMLDYHKIYPNYGFDKHKGYGTVFHYEMIARHGICPIHRRTFRLTKTK